MHVLLDSSSEKITMNLNFDFKKVCYVYWPILSVLNSQGDGFSLLLREKIQ